MTPVVELCGLEVRLGDRLILKEIELRVDQGEVLVIMGGSGCGKSTLLKQMIGLGSPSKGSVRLFGQTVSSGKHSSELRRRYGVLFQSGALLQSLTVAENIALPLIDQGVDRSLADIIVRLKLEMVGMTGFEDLKPAQLSGGMKKRVGLARALVLDPELLFSDEPTAGLDPIMTAVVDRLTIDLTRKLGMTAIVVTHDMTSAFRIATRMVMLGSGDHQGEIISMGTPDEIRATTNPQVRQFIEGHADGPIPMRMARDEFFQRLLEPDS